MHARRWLRLVAGWVGRRRNRGCGVAACGALTASRQARHETITESNPRTHRKSHDYSLPVHVFKVKVREYTHIATESYRKAFLSSLHFN